LSYWLILNHRIAVLWSAALWF